MKKMITALMAAAICLPLSAQDYDADSIPSRAIILTGDRTHPDHRNNIAVMY